MTEVELVYQELRQRLQPFVDRNEWGSGIACVYQPLDYAWVPFSLFLKRTTATPLKALFLGMNPGPWGMTQTGVPFGNVELVRTWLEIAAPIGKPKVEHPQRPILGFQTKRSEVSGERFWGLMKKTFQTADRFFAVHSVHTFCPLVFMDEGGRNVTPDKLVQPVRSLIEDECRWALKRLVELWKPRAVVCLGNYALAQAKALGMSSDVKVVLLPHPSPINPNSRNWDVQAKTILENENIWEK